MSSEKDEDKTCDSISQAELRQQALEIEESQFRALPKQKQLALLTATDPVMLEPDLEADVELSLSRRHRELYAIYRRLHRKP